MTGSLILVSTPIGNFDDISLRAIEVIKTCDILLVEERKPANRLLSLLGIKREYLLLNEHTNKETTEEAFDALLDGKTIAVISDAGTPLIADPGFLLVRKALEIGIKVTSVPGASSILPALQLSGFSLLSFTFVGFLSRDKTERAAELRNLRDRKETLVFLEAPYRLAQIIDDLAKGIGEKREAAICCDLTTKEEKIIRGTFTEIREHFQQHPFKGEFVIVVHGAGRRR